MGKEQSILAPQVSQTETESHVYCDDDGYTLTRFVKGIPRMYPDTRFSFRPVTPLERARALDWRRSMSEEQATLAMAKAASSRITEWNCRDRSGTALKPTAANMLRQHPELLNRICNIVIFAAEGGDPDPLPSRLDEQLTDTPDIFGNDSAGVVENERKNS